MSFSKKSKGKKKSKEYIPDDDSDEALELAWKPPAGMELVTDVLDSELFDYDTLKRNDGNLEIWAIRIPQGMKLKYLQDALIEHPESSSTGGALGQIIPNRGPIYNIRTVDEGGEGEELKTLSCLLPRKKKGGDLFIAPIPISRHIIITESPPNPTPALEPTLLPNTTRFKHDKRLLKHRFMPVGSFGGAGSKDDEADHEEQQQLSSPMQVDRDQDQIPIKKKKKKRKEIEVDGGLGDKKAKKRKVV